MDSETIDVLQLFIELNKYYCYEKATKKDFKSYDCPLCTYCRFYFYLCLGLK